MKNNRMGNSEYVRLDVNIPSNVEAYLRKNATSLLNGDSEYALDVFKGLMGYPDTYEMTEDEKGIFAALLEHYEGQAKYGNLSVLDGGLFDRTGLAEITEDEEELPEIRGVISDIEIFKEGSLIVNWKAENGDGYTIETLAHFRLDSDKYMIGYVKEVDAISYFEVEIDGEYTCLTPIIDEELFDLISQIWERLKIIKREAEQNEQ